MNNGERQANDIAERGVLQPVIVRPHPTDSGRCLLVFCERRWRVAERLIDENTTTLCVAL
jgi:ParB-like chromosome segregation protein Spo0J